MSAGVMVRFGERVIIVCLDEKEKCLKWVKVTFTREQREPRGQEWV